MVFVSKAMLPADIAFQSPRVKNHDEERSNEARELEVNCAEEQLLDTYACMAKYMEGDEVMTMLGELYGGQGDQQGHPNREGGQKLIQFESPRWRPKSSLSPPQNPGPVFLELVTQDAYGLHFL
jgi:hypothetical protein